jgi:hypothetical protein
VRLAVGRIGGVAARSVPQPPSRAKASIPPIRASRDIICLIRDFLAVVGGGSRFDPLAIRLSNRPSIRRGSYQLGHDKGIASCRPAHRFRNDDGGLELG